MKTLALFLVGALMTASGAASACGTPSPAMQAKIDLEESAQLRKIAVAAANEADEILIGTVTELEYSTSSATEFASVSLAVEETLKGESTAVRTLQWRDSIVISCKQSATFLNVGFRTKGKFIVYVRDGVVFRSAAADHLRSGMLTLKEERAIAIRAGKT